MARPEPLALLLSSVAYLYSSINNFDIPIIHNILVDTNYGQLRGFRSSARNGLHFYEFLGVPYAQPPIGELRFENPQPPLPWNGVRSALTYGSRCIQFERLTRTILGDEDCLFLNIFTHQVLTPDQATYTRLDPVIVFIHGGLFMSSMSNLYRPKYFMTENIVLVTLNYRLASFGFLNTGDGVVRGNMGLKDQTMALKWVQDNIKFFGGDPDRVTLVGESAGASSVHFHMLSPMSKGLFHAAISQSGSALSPWALTTTPIAQSKRFGKSVNCPTENSIDMVRCLKAKSARIIARVHADYGSELIGDRLALFSPTIEVVNDSLAFITEHPRKLLEDGNIANPVPWIAGVNKDEGLIYAASAVKNNTQRRYVNENFKKVGPIVLYYDDHPNNTEISEKIWDYYLGSYGGKISMNTLPQTISLFSDREFFEGVRDAAIYHAAAGAPVYLYYFTYQGKFGFGEILLSMSGSLPASIDTIVTASSQWIRSNVLRRRRQNDGICHADELFQFYNIPVISREILPGSPDYKMSNSLIKLWTSFARKGRPNDFNQVAWEPVNATSLDDPLYYLKIDHDTQMIEEPFAERLAFWRSLGINNLDFFDNINDK